MSIIASTDCRKGFHSRRIFRTKSVFSSAIRSTMLSVLSAIAVKTANAAAVGKFIVTSARLSRPLLNLKNAQKFIANYGRREEV